MRIFAVVSAMLLALSASASGIHAAVEAFLKGQGRWIIAPKYSDRPKAPFLGKSPGKDVIYRAGHWTPQTLRDLRNGRFGRFGQFGTFGRDPKTAGSSLWAISVLSMFGVQGGGGPPGGGGGGGGEGGGPGGGPGVGGGMGGSGGGSGSGGGPGSGGMVNTHTGNRMHTLPLVAWPSKGQLAVDFTLFHNSQTEYNRELGYGWSWTFGVAIDYTPSSSAIVRWADGLLVPFSENMYGDFTAPPGIHDILVKNQNGTFTLTTKSQIVFSFNSAGFLTSVSDRNGNTITLTLNQENLVTQVEDSSGRTLTITYDQDDRIATVTDPLDREWTFTYSNGELIEVTLPEIDSAFHSYEFTYNGNHDITSVTDLRGKVWTMEYDNESKLTAWEDPDENRWEYTYSQTYTDITNPLNKTIRHNYSSGMLASTVDEASFSDAYVWDSDKNLVEYTDRRGKVWEFDYDSNGNLLWAENPFDKRATFTYNGTNDLLTAEDALENLWEFSYDQNGNLESVVNPLEIEIVTCAYDGYGQLTSVTNALNKTVTLTYDTHGNITAATSPLNNTSTATYDALSRITSATDPENNTYSVVYDAWGRAKVFVSPDQTESSVVFDPGSLVLEVVNEANNVWSFDYDDVGRLVSVTNPLQETTTFAYNAVGWVTSVTNGRNFTRTYAYTDRGEVSSLTLPDNSVEQWTYNANGQVTAYTNPLSQVIAYVYDDAGRLNAIDYPTGTDTAFYYDDAGRLTSMTDATGSTAWTYDAASQLTLLETPQAEIAYSYNDAGQLVSMDHEGVGVTEYEYDDDGRLVSLTNPYEETTSFVYDDASRLTRKNLANGVYELYTYDNRSRLIGIQIKNSAHSLIDSHSYDYDAVSNIVERTSGGVTTEFGYDLVGQLISETRSGYSASYTYDANGNRLTRTVNSVTEEYSYDGADKLLEVSINSQTVKEFSYDAAGRTTSVTTSAGTTSLTWDYEDRLVGITYPSTATNSFGYNAFGARVSKTDSSGSFTFSRSGASSNAAILADGYAAYTPGLSERRGGVSRFYHFGGNGENGRETAENESTQSTRAWDAWGNQLSSTGSTNSPFGFLGGLGGEFDFDSTLILVGTAAYDPSTGRTLASPERGGRTGGANNWGGPGGHAPGSIALFPQIGLLDVPYLDGKPAIGYDATPWWQKGLDGAYDFVVGWGDGVSAGGSILVRELLGANDAVDFDSPWYQGGFGVGVVHGFVVSRGLKAPAACFVAETMILMADGSKKPIEEIQRGDLVMSRDEATGKTEAKEVVRVFERQSNELVVITLANGEEIRTTPEHPFSVEGKGWTAARDLKSFDRLATTSSTSSSIDSVQWMRTPSKVYNFEVEDYHTYFVSANGTEVWVHNACTPSGPKGTGANWRAKPNAEAIGAHTVFRRGPSGRVEHYTTYAPPRSPKNRSKFVPRKRFDGVGEDHGGVGTPHVHVPGKPDGPLRGRPRPPLPWEVPRGY